MLLGRRAESIAVAESVVEGVSPTPAIIRVMPLSWTATIVTSVRRFEQRRYARGGQGWGVGAATTNAAEILVASFVFKVDARKIDMGC